MPKIEFWRVDVGTRDSGVLEVFQHQHICDEISRIDWTTRKPEPMGWGASLISESSTYDNTRLTFAAVRAEELVLAEKGKLKPFNLKEGVGVAALTRAVFFHKNVVGLQVGPRAPGAGFVAKFLACVDPGTHKKVKLIPLYRTDADTMLNEIQMLSDLKLKIKPVDVARVPPGPMKDAVSKLKEAGFGTDSEGHISVQVHAGKDSRLRNIKKWISKFNQSEAGASSKLSVVGFDRDAQRVEIKFDDHRFVWFPQFDSRPSARTIQDKIAEYYNNHEEELAMATGLDIEVVNRDVET